MSKALEKHASDCLRDHIRPIMEQIEEVKKEVTEIKVSIASLPKALADEFDARYAGKENVDELRDTVRWISRLIIGAVIVAIIGLVLKK